MFPSCLFPQAGIMFGTWLPQGRYCVRTGQVHIHNICKSEILGIRVQIPSSPIYKVVTGTVLLPLIVSFKKLILFRHLVIYETIGLFFFFNQVYPIHV